MNVQMTPIDESDLMKLAIEEKKRPYLTTIRHAGWLLIQEMFYQPEKDGDWKFTWLASNNVTGRIVRFTTINDEPEPCYEAAAESLVDYIEDVLP
jgi:hypothetical protein